MTNYDRILWRLNGTLLLIACLATLVVCLVVGWQMLTKHDDPAIPLTNGDERLSLGAPRALKNSPLMLIPLTPRAQVEISYDVAYPDARNYLVFDALTKESRWLWTGNARAATQDSVIFDQIAHEETQKARGLVVTTRKDETRTVEWFDLAARKSAVITEAADRVIGVQQTRDDEVVIFYARTNKSYFKTLTPSTAAVAPERELAAE